MAKKQPVEEVIEVMDSIEEVDVETHPVVEPTTKANKTTKMPRVLSRFRVENVDNDGYVYERVIVDERLAGQKGVKEFVADNGKVTYYLEKLVKKYSENVVKA